MIDREKVMTWLEICGKNNDCSGCYPYSENGFGEYGQCRESLMTDAYNLLKEQDAVEFAREFMSDAVHETAKQFRQTIVRCKDCKHGEPGACGYGIDCEGVWHEDDWFCADGEGR